MVENHVNKGDIVCKTAVPRAKYGPPSGGHPSLMPGAKG